MVTWIVASAIVIALYILIYYNFLSGVPCRSDTSLKGRTAIVTGANSGLGKATALDFARRGARVIAACRSKQRAEAAILDIRKKSGNNQVIYMHLDLASLKSVRVFAETFLKSEPHLHLLVNNAGTGRAGQTADGFNAAWGVNHLGHFLLTALLLDRLKQCAPSRIVVVSSLAHCLGRVDLSDLTSSTAGFVSSLCSYGTSKLCNVLFARELANRLEGTNVTSYSVHPGERSVAGQTALQQDQHKELQQLSNGTGSISGEKERVTFRVETLLQTFSPEMLPVLPSFVFTDAFRNLGIVCKLLFFPVAFLFFRTPADGAQTIIYCAVQEGIEKFSGRYFADCGVRKVSPHARDDAVARKVWEVSERLAGLHRD